MSFDLISVWIQLIFILFLSITSIDGTSNALKLVQIVQRHGDRNPTNFYTNDKYKNESYWKDGIGQLTRTGKTRMFEFGLTIRLKYQDYLTDSPRDVSVRSSALIRTLESSQVFMAGLYEPKGFWIWNNDSNVAKVWQPIAVNTVLPEDDGLLRTSAICPKADRLWNEFMRSQEVIDYLNENKEFIQYLTTKTGDEYWNVSPSPLRPLEFLSTTLRVERENNLEMPEWADNNTLKHLRDLEIHAFYYDWKSPQIQRLRAGLILKELAQNMLNRADEIVNKTTNNVKNLYVYETHDVNQVVLMQALNVYDLPEVNITPPTYTASLVFELHQTDNDFVVKLLYFKDVKLSNHSIDDFVELKLVNCDPEGKCTLKKFIESIDNLIPNDWELECERISLQNNSYNYFNIFSLVYILCGFLLALIIGLFIKCLTKRQKSDQLKDETNILDIKGSKNYT